MLVVLTHVCEARHLPPAMHWGLEHSAGQRWSGERSFGSRIVPNGYLLQALHERQ
jgi:hypothetical protein